MNDADIESTPLFARLSADDRARVATASRPVQLDAGDVIVNEGEFACDFDAIKQGAAEVRRAGERVRALGLGDVFSEIAVVLDNARRWTRRRSASVIVTVPTDAIVIDGRDFGRGTEESPHSGMRYAPLLPSAGAPIPRKPASA